MLESFWICADEIKDPLFRVSQRQEPAVTSQRLDDTPLIRRCVLKLVEYDNGIGIGDKTPDFVALVEQFSSNLGKEIITDQSFFSGDTSPLGIFSLLFLLPLLLAQLVV